MNRDEFTFFKAVSLAMFVVGTQIFPCAGQTSIEWQPTFETDGMESELATKLSKWKRWGFIDKSGTFVIEPKYDLVKPFKDGVTTVGNGERYFKIDKTGKAVSQDLTRVQVINEENQKRWARQAKEKQEDEAGKYKGDIFDASGTKLLGPSTDFIIGKFSEGLASCEMSPRTPADYAGAGMNRTGYIDDRGRMVIGARFCQAEPFRNGIAKVQATGYGRLGYGEGFINKSGELLGGHFYNVAWNFDNGLAIVETIGKAEEDDEWGYLDKSGKELLGHWTKVAEFSGRAAGVRDKSGFWGFVDKEGSTILPYKFSFVGDAFSEHLTYVKTKDGFGYIDESGHFAIAPSLADADDFSEGLAPGAVAVPEAEKLFALSALQTWRCGFIDPSGKKIAGGYFAARHFSEGFAAVNTGLKWGFINDKGEMAIPAIFDDARPFSQGLAAVCVDDLWGFIDKTGSFKIQPVFLSRDFAREGSTYPRPFSEGISIAAFPDYYWRFIDLGGKVAFRLPKPMSVNIQPRAQEFADGLAVVQDELHYFSGYIDHEGRLRIPAKLEKASSFAEGLAAVGVNNAKLPLRDVEQYVPPEYESGQPKCKFGFIDKSGKFIVQPEFDEVGSFHNGLAAVGCGKYVMQEGGVPGSIRLSKEFPAPSLQAKWGFVDRSGHKVIDLKFDGAKFFSEGLAPVQAGTKWGFITELGKYEVQPQFDSANPFSSGLARVSKDGKYGFVDHHGRTVVKLQYPLAGSFSDERALVVTSMDTATPISTAGRIYSAPVKSSDDILKFLLERGAAPDDYLWAGFRH